MVDVTTRMMWLSQNTKLSFEDRLREALKYYQKKYGVASLCFVHSSMLVNGMGDEKPIEVDGSKHQPPLRRKVEHALEVEDELHDTVMRDLFALGLELENTGRASSLK